jgi:beta-glucosidase
VLTGAAEPTGRMPQTSSVRWADNPVQSQDREIYPGLAGKVRYDEGLFIGCRHYDRLGSAPLFPFGFGLSYTSFELSNLAIDADGFEADGIVTVSVTSPIPVGNPVQTWFRSTCPIPKPHCGDPQKELKGFAKVTSGPTKRDTSTRPWS